MSELKLMPELKLQWYNSCCNCIHDKKGSVVSKNAGGRGYFTLEQTSDKCAVNCSTATHRIPQSNKRFVKCKKLARKIEVPKFETYVFIGGIIQT